MYNGKYRVRVQTSGVRKHVGVFKYLIDAIEARRKYAQKAHGEFFRES